MQNEIVRVNDKQIVAVEWNGERVVTTAQLADIYEATDVQIKQNYGNNEARFKEGEHFYLLRGEELRAFKNMVEDFDLVGKNANQLYLWTRRGASRHCKMLGTDKAWEQFDALEENYYNPKVRQLDMSELSPELQMFQKIFNSVVEQQIEQKRQAEKVEQLDKKVDSIKDVIALNPNSWRTDSAKIVNKIALQMGGYEHIKAVREESYKILEDRMGVALNIRLSNKKKTQALNGVSKSKIDKLNQLDVIADDKKLIQGYVSVIKDMAIKYGVTEVAAYV